MRARAGAGGACSVALWIVLLASAGAPSAVAGECPNAQFRSGPSERLPDCRAYEQVSPQAKGGLDAVTLDPMEPAQSSACEQYEPCTIAYMNVGASFAGAEGNEPPDAYLGSRQAAGWQTVPLSPPTPQAPADAEPRVDYDFSADLSEVVLRVPLQQLTEGAPPNVYNLYLREPGGGYSLLTSSPPGQPPVSGCSVCFEEEDVPMFAGASADFTHVLFEANDGLEGAPSGEIEGPDGEMRPIENLYEAVAGRVRPVDTLPDGSIAARGESPGGGLTVIPQQVGEVEHAISADGSHVLFTAEADHGEPDPEQEGRFELYDRIDGTSTIELSTPAPGARSGECDTQAGACNVGAARFWSASADGSHVYFTSKATLTPDAFTGPEESPLARREKERGTGEQIENPGDDLYLYDFHTGKLSDLTPDSADAEDTDGADVLGVVGAAEDGSYVYFVADGHLTPEAPPGLAPHLYVWHEASEGAGSVSYIATLAEPHGREEQNIDGGRTGPSFHYRSDILDWSSDPQAAQAYVTPDGRHLAFMSVEPLTGYDNVNLSVEEGHPVHEVFEYSAQTGQIECASCDPGEAEPLGSAFLGAGLSERASTAFHQPRSLSDDGSRLFFTSPDLLVSGLAGGAEKVFEYEDGRVQLISGAEAGENATFLDASASGDDVFFATRERLAPSDTDELLDVYDARVDGGLPPPSAPASCTASACGSSSSAALLLSPPPLAAPLSATFSGAGNLAAKAPAPASRKELLARALVACRELKARRKRVACEDAAKRRYAPKLRRTTRRAALARPAAGR
jgi:hypothetical protein